jgi:hypothetical protein
MMAIALIALFVAVVGVAMNFARTPPEEAKVNLGRWLAHLPRWERYVAIFVNSLEGRLLLGILLVGALVVLFWPPSNVEPTTNLPPNPPSPTRSDPRSNELPNLTPERQRNLVAAFGKLKAILPVVVVTTNGYANGGYANKISELFGMAGIEPSRGIQIPGGPSETGIMISAKNPNNLSKAAREIFDIFTANGLEPKLTPNFRRK